MGLIGGVAPAAADLVVATAPGVTEPAAAPRLPSAGPRLQVGVHGALRVTVLDGHGDRFADDAMAYGWRTAAAAPLVGGSIDVSYLWTPIVDLGVSAGWMTADFAAGLDLDNDRLRVRTTTLAGTARLHWMQGRPFVPEPRVDLGVIRERIEVHGTFDTRHLPYLRAGVDWRLGTPTAGVTLALGYTMVDGAPADPVAPPLGGLDLGVGPYVRF